MTSIYENPPMPQELLDDQEKADAARAGLSGAQTTGKISGMRYFVSPLHPNTKFLVNPGKMSNALVAGGQILRWPEREGEKWARFVNGACPTDDSEVIEWLEAHAGNQRLHIEYYQKRGKAVPKEPHWGFCRDINSEGVEAWAELKAQQIPLAHRPATISPGLAVDKLFAGKAADMPFDHQSGGSNLVGKTRQDAAVNIERS